MLGFMTKFSTVSALYIVTMVTLSVGMTSFITVPAARLAHPRLIRRLPGKLRMWNVMWVLIHKRLGYTTLFLTVCAAPVGVFPRVCGAVTSWRLLVIRSSLVVLVWVMVRARSPGISGGVATVTGKRSGRRRPMISTIEAMLLRYMVAWGAGGPSVAYPPAQAHMGFRWQIEVIQKSLRTRIGEMQSVNEMKSGVHVPISAEESAIVISVNTAACFSQLLQARVDLCTPSGRITIVGVRTDTTQRDMSCGWHPFCCFNDLIKILYYFLNRLLCGTIITADLY